MRNPKLLFVAPTPPPYSGPEIMTERILTSKLRESFDMVHYNISKKREIETKGHFDLVNILFGVFQPFKLFFLMVKNRPVLMYTLLPQNYGGFLRYASFILVSRLFKAKVVVRVTGGAFDKFYDKAPIPFRFLIHKVLNSIDAFIVRANCLKQQFGTLVPKERLYTIYIGLDPNEFAFREDSRKGDDTIKVLFVGHLSKAKGAIDLLKAIPLVIKCIDNIKFVFVGPRLSVEKNIKHIENPIDNTEIVEKVLEEEKINNYVEFRAVVTGKKKLELFHNADILILPSYSEAFPVVVLEAMMTNTAVIATRVGALPEVFENGKEILFVKTGSPEDIASKVIKLATNKELLYRIKRNAKKTTIEKFNLDVMVKRKEEMFFDVINNTRQRN